MDVSFYKVRSLRNDFILFPAQSGLSESDEAKSMLSTMASRRRSGIGAIGVIFLRRSQFGTHEISMYDHNGLKKPKNLDALVCAARYLIDSGQTDGSNVRFQLENEEAYVEVIDSKQLRVRVGTPRSPSTGDRMDDSISHDFGDTILIDGRRLPVVPVELGNKFLVFAPPPAGWRIKLLNSRLRADAARVDHTPVFVRPMSPDALRVSCRPIDEPADSVCIVSSAVVAAISNGYVDGIVVGEYAGESAFIEWKKDVVYATVAPGYVYTGEAHFESPAFHEVDRQE